MLKHLNQQKQRFGQLINPYFNITDIKNTYSLLKPFILKQWKVYLVLLVLLVVDIFFTLAFAWFFGNLTEAAIHSDFERLKSLVLIGILVHNYKYRD